LAKVRAEHVHQISPSAKPELLPEKDGYVKIRLTYLTMEPKHIRSAMLRVQGIQPPFMEEVCILMPQARVFPLIETFMPAFDYFAGIGRCCPRL
jgi:hypothetical protein